MKTPRILKNKPQRAGVPAAVSAPNNSAVQGLRLFAVNEKAPWFVVTTGRGLEAACLEEIQEIAENLQLSFASPPQAIAAGVRFQAEWEVCVALNCALTTASRVLLPLAAGVARSLDDVYQVASQVDWPALFGVEKTISVGAQVNASPIHNSMMVALKVKDAIADGFRRACGQRPNVDTKHPDLRIAVRILGPELEISLNTSGEALSHHGYRKETGAAPLRENLAAAILRYSGYHELIRQLGSPEPIYYERVKDSLPQVEPSHRRIPVRLSWSPVICDPMCGSGTILIEAAQALLRRSPGVRREAFSFLHLKNGNRLELLLRKMKQRLVAHERSIADVHALASETFRQCGISWDMGKPFLIGYDINAQAIAAAKENAAAAGVSKLIDFQRKDALKISAPAAAGLCLVNPPYAERLGGSAEDVLFLYQNLGNQWKNEFSQWMCWLISGNSEALKKVGLRPTRKVSLFNGNLPCSLQQYIIY